MLDIKLIRRDPDAVASALSKRVDDLDLGPILAADKEVREIGSRIDELRALRNKVADDIGRARAKGLPDDELRTRAEEINKDLQALEPAHRQKQAELEAVLAGLPNMPADEVIPGGKEANRVVRQHSAKPDLGSWALDHVTLSQRLGLVDHARGTKLGGGGFWIYTGRGAALEWALLDYFCKTHYKNGYEFILPPHILTNENGYAAGQFPKFYDDVFRLEGSTPERGQFLIPTAETSLLNIYRDEILDGDQLPIKMFAYTPCYRREAGGAGSEERGTVRGHQFNKVEMFQFTKPEQARKSFEDLVSIAEQLLMDLGLHFQTSALAAKDISASMCLTHDLEVWIPSMTTYKEVSSVSWAGDFQARRAQIRYREKAGGAPRLVHTLNGSGLATSRLMPAILEQHQRPDGSVAVPKPLQAWLGTDLLEPI